MARSIGSNDPLFQNSFWGKKRNDPEFTMLSFSGKWHIFAASFVTFLLLNTIENLIHYNIGRTSDSRFHFLNPTPLDWVRIIGTMIGFAILQGGFTLLMDRFLFQKKP